MVPSAVEGGHTVGTVSKSLLKSGIFPDCCVEIISDDRSVTLRTGYGDGHWKIGETEAVEGEGHSTIGEVEVLFQVE
jgi:hypothetical protein